MANAPAHGLDTREHTTMTDRVSTLRTAVDDYNRMHEMMKTASPTSARQIAEDMRLQERVIDALCDCIGEEVRDGQFYPGRL